MAENLTDPFGRPLDTSPPIVMTEAEARKRMAEVAREESESAEEVDHRSQEDRDWEIEQLEAVANANEEDIEDGSEPPSATDIALRAMDEKLGAVADQVRELAARQQPAPVTVDVAVAPGKGAVRKTIRIGPRAADGSISATVIEEPSDG